VPAIKASVVLGLADALDSLLGLVAGDYAITGHDCARTKGARGLGKRCDHQGVADADVRGIPVALLGRSLVHLLSRLYEVVPRLNYYYSPLVKQAMQEFVTQGIG
jgi:hypothetical protein